MKRSIDFAKFYNVSLRKKLNHSQQPHRKVGSPANLALLTLRGELTDALGEPKWLRSRLDSLDESRDEFCDPAREGGFDGGRLLYARMTAKGSNIDEGSQ